MNITPLSGQVPYLRTRAGTKVFCFFSSEKKFFSEEKNQKTFISSHVGRYGIWPERDVMR